MSNNVYLLFQKAINERKPIEEIKEIFTNNDISKLDTSTTDKIMSLAIAKNRQDVIELLLPLPNVDINKADSTGDTPLLRAISYHNPDIVRLLLTNPNTDVNKSNTSEVSPLLRACYYGHDEIAEQLLSKPDIDVNKADSTGETPLIALCSMPLNADIEPRDFMAMWPRIRKIVKLLLLSSNIDINLRDNKGRDAYSYAEETFDRKRLPDLKKILDAYKKINRAITEHLPSIRDDTVRPPGARGPDDPGSENFRRISETWNMNKNDRKGGKRKKTYRKKYSKKLTKKIKRSRRKHYTK
jgi:hypothetical protein